MLTISVALIGLGAALIQASLKQQPIRHPLPNHEEEQTLSEPSVYTGPIYTRHGRVISK